MSIKQRINDLSLSKIKTSWKIVELLVGFKTYRPLMVANDVIVNTTEHRGLSSHLMSLEPLEYSTDPNQYRASIIGGKQHTVLQTMWQP